MLKDVTVMEWLTLVAIAFGPFFGIWAYGIIEERKRAYHRRLDIFKTLMATRGAVISPAHVEALNRIDVEFTGRKYQNIRDEWTAYLDHLVSGPKHPDPLPNNPDEATIKGHERAWAIFDNDVRAWSTTSYDRLVRLLSEMSQVFNYQFDEVRIKKGVYRPKGHTDIEDAQQRLLNAAAATFEGRRSLAMWVTNWPEQSDEQKATLQVLQSTVDNGAYRVKLVDRPPVA